MKSETVSISLSATADKTKTRPGGSRRHVHFFLKVSEAVSRPERKPVKLALVMDRSGSMHGDKIMAAREAASMVIRSLEERDSFSVVSFDEKIETMVPCTEALPEEKAKALSIIAVLEARGSTNLHTGWLTGCRSIAVEEITEERISHCFLLSDGLANHGEMDPEIIATAAADVRINTGIRTSTFGIGDHYDESLLGPMAVAGGGQFHHLRTADEIAGTFRGELAELFTSAAQSVKLELDTDRDMEIESISDYHTQRERGNSSVLLDIGNLMELEERHVVVRVNVPAMDTGGVKTVRCRLHWTAGNERKVSETGELQFECASDEECSKEIPDPKALHWTGLHHAARTKKIVMMLLRDGESSRARKTLQAALSRLRSYPPQDMDIRNAVRELEELLPMTEESAVVDTGTVKEAMYSAQLYSRGQRDYRRKQ